MNNKLANQNKKCSVPEWSDKIVNESIEISKNEIKGEISQKLLLHKEIIDSIKISM